MDDRSEPTLPSRTMNKGVVGIRIQRKDGLTEFNTTERSRKQLLRRLVSATYLLQDGGASTRRRRRKAGRENLRMD